MNIDEIKETISTQLQSHGFPTKRVSFPEKSLEGFVAKYDFSLVDVLGELEGDEIFHERLEGKIVFSQTLKTAKDPLAGLDLDSLNLDALKNMDPKTLAEQAKNWMGSLTPEQKKELETKFQDMSPEEKQKIMDMGRQWGLK